MKKKKTSSEKRITNKRAYFDYDLGDSLVVGLELTGKEVKSLRMGHGHLRGAYVTVKDSPKGKELYLLNATITGTNAATIDEIEKTRSRKLLAKRNEIDKLVEAKQQGQSIVPTELLTKGRYIKLRISVGRGKKNYDKRETMKQRDEKRTVDRELKRRQH